MKPVTQCWPSARRDILCSWRLALVFWGTTTGAAVIILVVFVVSVLLLNSAARALGGRRAALAALLLFVLWPSDIFITGLAVSEPLTLLLFTAGLWLFSLCDVHGAKASVVAGIVGGVTALTRPTMLLFPLLWAVFALVGPNF